MNVRIGLAGALVSIGVLGVLALYAGAQAPSEDPQATPPPPTRATVYRQNADGTIVEETLDGKLLQATTPGRQPNAGFVPWTTQQDGRTVPVYSDPESVRMASEEQATAQEARALAALYARAESDAAKDEAKKKLREKLAAIFDLQQQRRAHEIAKIEERLGKLKDTMKKRDTSKDPIIDRRRSIRIPRPGTAIRQAGSRRSRSMCRSSLYRAFRAVQVCRLRCPFRRKSNRVARIWLVLAVTVASSGGGSIR
jgi:hypothetical protein